MTEEEAVELLVIMRYYITQNPISSGSYCDHGVNYFLSIDTTVLNPLGKVPLRLRINQSPRKEIWVEKLRFLLDEVQAGKGTDPATRRETVQWTGLSGGGAW
ncbi:hypothetical protein BJ742DRAFT_775900 [Cladochytrium replicatum]|nr:hypothetical protein BJ742DRAFT_775900 [Cladochytrium replicatum]